MVHDCLTGGIDDVTNALCLQKSPKGHTAQGSKCLVCDK